MSIYYSGMPEQQQRQHPQEDAPWAPKQSPFDGPKNISGDKPDTKSILKKIRSVDPNQSRKYKQRQGE
jgi:hypothetical protein